MNFHINTFTDEEASESAKETQAGLAKTNNQALITVQIKQGKRQQIQLKQKKQRQIATAAAAAGAGGQVTTPTGEPNVGSCKVEDMNSHATATQNGQSTVVGHHRGYSQPSSIAAAAATAASGGTAGDPWYLQATGHQMPPTAPLRHNKRPAPQPNSMGVVGVGVGVGAAATLLHQQQLSQSQPHIMPPSIPPHHHHHHRDNNAVCQKLIAGSASTFYLN